MAARDISRTPAAALAALALPIQPPSDNGLKIEVENIPTLPMDMPAPLRGNRWATAPHLRGGIPAFRQVCGLERFRRVWINL